MSWDLAASAHNTKCEQYIDKAKNTFKVKWYKLKGKLFLNPPYSNIKKFAAKCVRESKRGAHIFFLVPASVGSNWFRDHVFEHARVWFLNGRLKFIGHRQCYPKDLVLIEYTPKGDTGCKIWNWRTGDVW